MPLFRKKPVVIEAFRFLPDEPCPGWMQEAIRAGRAYYQGGDDPYITIKTLEGEMRANAGDWILKGVAGEIYPCKPAIFAETYQPVAMQDGFPAAGEQMPGPTVDVPQPKTIEELIDHVWGMVVDAQGQEEAWMDRRWAWVPALVAISVMARAEKYGILNPTPGRSLHIKIAERMPFDIAEDLRRSILPEPGATIAGPTTDVEDDGA